MELEGYTWSAPDFAELLIRRHFPERTDGESAVIKEFLLAHLKEYDRITFAKRIGRGVPPNAEHLPAVQQNTLFSSKLRIDILAWKGNQPVLVEVKQRVTPASLGQVLTYRHHFREENPDVADPEMVVVGREASEDAIAALRAEGVTVYLYADATPRTRDAP